MSEHNKRIQDFLQTTCEQIKYKSVHKGVINELFDHIEEQKCEYLKHGLDEETATLKALEQMGDPVLVGKQLDKAHQPRTEWSILLLAGILVLIGGIVQFFISKVYPHNSVVFSSFLIYAPIGIAAFLTTYFFDYTLLGRYPKLVYCALFAASVAGYMVQSRICFSYTYVYYAVLLFIPAFAGIIYGFRNRGYLGIIACGLFYAGVTYLCVIAPRLGSLILLTAACLILLTVAIIKGFFRCNKIIGLAIVYIPTVATAILISTQYLFLNAHRKARIAAMVNPNLDPQGGGYQYLLIRKLIAASRPFGEAVLSGRQANVPAEQLLPCWSTDCLFTYIIARLGYVAGLAIALIIFAFIVRMLICVVKQKNSFGFLLSCAACISLAGQFIIFILSNIGVMGPTSGILPLISFGGMGFVTNMILIGIVLSVYRRTDIVTGRHQDCSCNNRLIRIEDGKLIIDLLGSKFSKNTD